MKNVLHLFQSCVPVKGHTRSTICDLERLRFYYIPNSMYAFLKKYHHASHQTILDEIDKEHHHIIQEYLDFLIENELATWIPASDAKLFIKMPEEWKSYNIISNMIVEFSEQTFARKEAIVALVNRFQTEGMGLLLSDKFNADQVIAFIKYFEGSCTRSFDIIVDTPAIDNETLFIKTLESIPYVFNIRFYRSQKNDVQYKKEPNDIYITYSTDNYIDTLHNYKANISNFITSNALFFESKIYNSYFNQKMFLDKDCLISNAFHTPAFCELNALLNDANAAAVINQNNDLWHINKSKIKICKSCEHRYICVDSRIPAVDQKSKAKQYAYTTSCGYDPLKGEWSNK